MAYEKKDNSGSLFQNDRKESANHPDGKGSAMIDGVEYWVSSWNKTTSEGKPWRSMSFTRKEQAPQRPAPDKAGQWKAGAPKAPQRQHAPAEDDSDIPF